MVDSEKVFNKIFKKFNSIEELNDHFIGKGEWNKEYTYSEGAHAVCSFCEKHSLLGDNEFWIEEPDSDEEEKWVGLWCIYEHPYTKKQVCKSMEELAKKVKELTAFKMEWEHDKQGENYVQIRFNF